MRLGSEDGTFVLVEWTADTDTNRDRPIAALHLHREEDEAWYVLEGRLGFRIGEDEVEAGPGEAAFVAQGTPHTYWNAASVPSRYLLVMGPRTAAMIEELHKPGTSDYAAVFERYGSELV
jgi:mannose-6-phosphate isomerase-like protein (cupin superfamily)